jgi:Tol biopolymer transport system component
MIRMRLAQGVLVLVAWLGVETTGGGRRPLVPLDARPAASSQSAPGHGDRPVWTGRGVAFGSVSPDGRFITYVDWTETFNLMVRDLATNTSSPLTSLPSMLNNPSYKWVGQAGGSTISLDGREVAYSWIDTESFGIRVMRLAGSGQPRQLVSVREDEVRFINPLDWSADGRWIAVTIQRTDKTCQMVLVGAADGTTRVLKSTDWTGCPARMAFSRDSRQVAYDGPAGEAQAGRDLWLLPIDGSGTARRMVGNAGRASLVGWSPDGARLLFITDRADSPGLWAQLVVDGAPRGEPDRVRSDLGGVSTSMAVLRRTETPIGVTASGAVYVFKQLSDRDIRTVGLDLTSARIVGPSAAFAEGLTDNVALPSWSPDGRSLVYACGGACVVVRDARTGAVRPLRVALLDARNVRWSPDGVLAVAGRDLSGQDGVFLVDAATGDTRPLARGTMKTTPQWSPDGRTMFHGHWAEALMAHDVASGAEKEVVPANPLTWERIVSPDGRFVAIKTRVDPGTRMSRLFIVPVAGGDSRELLRLPDGEAFAGLNTLAWTPDSRALLVVKNAPTVRTTGGTPELWLVPVSGEPPRQFVTAGEWPEGAFAALAGGFSVSPDGTRLAFVGGTTAAEVWAIDGVAPGGSYNR